MTSFVDGGPGEPPKGYLVVTTINSATAALVATDTSLWWFEGYCRIGKMYKAKAVYVQAHCGGNDVGVTLDAQGNRMRVTWGKGKAEELQRCP